MYNELCFSEFLKEIQDIEFSRSIRTIQGTFTQVSFKVAGFRNSTTNESRPSPVVTFYLR